MMPPPFSTDELRRLLALQEGQPGVVAERLRWLLDFAEHGSVSGTCQRFGIARTTFYRWAGRFDPSDLSTLADRPTRPDTARGTAGESLTSPPEGERPIPSRPARRPSGLNWQAVGRAAVVASIITNIAVIAMLLASAAWERKVTVGRVQATVSPETPGFPLRILE